MPLKSVLRVTAVALTWCSAAAPFLAQSETHSNLQAVTATGASAWTGTFPFTLRGVLLCNPDEMLDPTPNFLPWNEGANQYRMGGEWQITFQAIDPGDRGGTTCWMGQNYGNMPWIHDRALSYSNAAWSAEILRLNFDPATLHQFRAGDLIEVTARQSLFYGGKRNINEGHDIDPAHNLDLALVTPNYGLPAPEVVTLADLAMPDDGDPATSEFIFDQSRAVGAEHYQGMRVRINNLTLVTTNGWNPANLWGARTCTVTDDANRLLTVGTPRYSLGPVPASQFDAIGIFSQESGSGSQGTNGYELFVQQVMPHAPTPSLAIGINTIITWPVSADAYQLEFRAEADAGTWTPVTDPAPVALNGSNTVILPPSSPQRFYRLRKTN